MTQQNVIKLSEKQRWAFYSPATEMLYGGAAGGGKSLYLRLSAIRWCMEVPGCQVYFFRRSYPDLRDNHLQGPKSFLMLLAPLISSGDVVYRASQNDFFFPKLKSCISLRHCQHEKDVYNYQGAEIHVLIIDELTHFTESMFRFLRSRVRCIGLNVPDKYKHLIPRIESGSNPGNVGHAWVKRTFDLGRNSTKKLFEVWQAPEDDGGLKRQYIPAVYTDNPQLLIDDPGYLNRLKGIGPDQLVNAMLYGDWDVFAGQFFKFEEHTHVVSDYHVEPHWRFFAGFDWGFNHPFVFGLYAVDEDGLTIKFKEIGARGKTVEQIANDIKSAVPEFIKLSDLIIYAGADCWAKRDGGPCIADRFADQGIFLTRANIDRIQGANSMREMLTTDAAKPKLIFTKNCWRAIKQIPAMIIDPNRPEDVLKIDASQEDEWAGDDAYDETRYAIHSWITSAKQDNSKQYSHLKPQDELFWRQHKDDMPHDGKTEVDFFQHMFS